MPDVAPQILLGGVAAHAVVADVSVTILDAKSWTDASIVRFLEESKRLGDGTVAAGALTWVRGASFDAHQRKVAHRWLQENGVSASPRNALVSDSAITRGALTAFAWLTQMETKAFGPNERAAACAWIARGQRARPEAVEAALAACEKLLTGSSARAI